MANVLTVVATLSAKPGKGDELAAILAEQVAAVVKAEPDCLVYRLHRSKKNPDLFLFYASSTARTPPSTRTGRGRISRRSATAAILSSRARRRCSSTSR
jgi:hypothetical protein